MFVSVTRLRLRHWRFAPGFAWYAIRARGQASRSPGFQGGSLLADRRLTFWTLTCWGAADDMRAYMTTGDHGAAMPRLAGWCDEASVAHWEQAKDALPSWTEADRRMRGEGRPSKVRHPSASHADLSYDAPRLTGAAAIEPRRRTG